METYLPSAVRLESDAEVMRFASDHVTLQGAYVELGVCLGRTVNVLAALNPKQPIYGFDSFEGLPEDWVRGDFTLPKGTYALKDPEKEPLLLGNIELIKGWFKDSLPLFAKEKLQDQPIAFLHIDCEIYTSAAEALTILAPYIQERTILLFDELYNYPGFENHEWKALNEFLQAHGWAADYLAYNIYHEQVVVRVRR
ncbi:MAG TPA: class I SAM-dependent methyltransferase [Chlamydiales bacterium]|nr:class I SAM-dependent methyltransferase [Chlamydiales bacterium]